ncbi:site-specific integrase [uncultured Acidaminococcus sp.]|uniref:tyrosine-type recombinase/integrase n=1 Tax=uncultured Acidaminococcus sp. TaxID=352152 RepID=UPI00266EC808|nr:site-specific integrase [uncultured Acidaminococcus sp.]
MEEEKNVLKGKSGRCRRGNGEGSASKRGNTWYGQFSITRNHQLIRKGFTADSKLELLEKGRKWMKCAQQSSLPLTPGKVTFGQFIRYWLAQHKKMSVKPKTYQKYVTTFSTYLLPVWNDENLAKISSVDVQNLINDYSSGQRTGSKGKPLSSSTVRCIRRYLSEAFRYAVQVNLLTKNPVELTKAPLLEVKEIHVLSIEELHRLLHAMKAHAMDHIGDPHEMLYYSSFIAVQLAASTGMRLGEVFGLCWDCVDLEDGSISVRRSIQTGGKLNIFQTTKTKHSRRLIRISADLAAELKKYRSFQNQYATRLGDHWHNVRNALITGLYGNILSTSNFKARYFLPVLAKLGIHDFSFHDLRHTHATLLLAKGVNPKIVQERLGHSTITLTLDTYSHLVPDIQKAAVRALDDLGI